MKKGQIILGAIALVVTAGSTLAFKAASKFNGHPRVFVKAPSGSCFQCKDVFTKLVGASVTAKSCHTAVGGVRVTGGGSNKRTFFTNTGCTNKLTKITKVS